MPRSSSPFDDPFADLFGKLPDPRERGAAAAGPRRAAAPEQAGGENEESTLDDGGSVSGSTPAAPIAGGRDTEDTPPQVAPATGGQPAAPTAATAPTSRRAAREAALAATGPAPTAAPDAPVPATAAVAADPARPVPASDALRAEQAVPAPAAALPISSFDEFIASSTASASAMRAAVPSAPAQTADRPAQAPGLEDLFTGRSSSDDIGDVPPPPDKRKRRIGGWIALAIVLLLLGGIAAGGLWVWNTYEDKIREFMGWEEPKDYEEGQATGEALVTISTGDTGGVISQSLYDAGVTKTPEAFYDMLVETAQNPTFYPGVYQLQQKMTSAAALTALQDPANKLENSALLREGLTVDQILPIVSEGVGIPLEELQAAVADPTVYGVPVDPAIAAAGGQPLEGWLFPAMYTFDPGVTAQQVIQTMVDRTIQSLDAAGVPVEDRQRILTIASIIQREASFEADMQKVSRVIQNRLDSSNDQTFGLLQMDSTAQYGYGEMHDGTVSSSQEALDDPNPWNTYQNPGLPIGPIANPGDVAIDAAMHPADGPWFYFVTVNPDTGETVFTETVQDHEKYVAQWQEWCAANPGKC